MSYLNFELSDDEVCCKTEINWQPADENCRRAWANIIDTTENGAYGVALAAVEMMRGMVAISRAETLTGADFYIAPISESYEDLEDCFRLEVSGTDSDRLSDVRARLRQKLKQTQNGNSDLPAIALVIGFQVKVILIQTATGSAQ